MRLRWTISLLAFALSGLHAEAFYRSFPYGTGHSYHRVPLGAVEPGAVYELKLRVSWEDVAGYLDNYARWYLPVDQSKDSGRKLLTVLTREHGDHYNLVFLYWYESAQKLNYYCKYRKAFFKIHATNEDTKVEFREAYSKVAENYGWKDTFEETIANLPAECPPEPNPVQNRATTLAEQTIQAFDLVLAKMAQLDEGSWNFDVNLCKVAELKRRPAVSKEALEQVCPKLKRSMLERAVGELEW
jgi:hypothetical protein